MMRTNLKLFRVTQHLSQEQIADKLGCNRHTYSAIERGQRNGRREFWVSLQNAFAIPDEDLWGLMKRDGE